MTSDTLRKRAEELTRRLEPRVKTAADDKQGEAIHAIWHDPTTYDALRHGPPYLPEGGGVKTGSEVKVLDKAAILDELGGAADVAEMYAPLYGGDYAPLSVLLAWMKATSNVHQAHHWASKGHTSYGDHLLFQRLYEDSQDFIDQLAERAVGLGGVNLINPKLQAAHVAEFVCKIYKLAGDVSMAEISLRAEGGLLYLLKVIEDSYARIDLLTPGLSNLLEGIADKHEEFVYLLQQRLALPLNR